MVVKNFSQYISTVKILKIVTPKIFTMTVLKLEPFSVSVQ